MDLRFIQIPKIESDILFEEFCRDLLSTDDRFDIVNLNGRHGQDQDGVDVFARIKNSSNWIGVQCKVRSTNRAFTKKELQSEIDQAKNFIPKLSKYFLYTTLNRDITTQELVREINDELVTEKQFSFEILFWEDIEEVLKQEQNEMVHYRYYHKFFKDNTSLGHSIGKLINLGLQFDNLPDTHYEIILGKIPKNNDNGNKVDYYRGTYFIVNLMDKKIEFFTKSQTSEKAICHTSDIENAFDNSIDRYRICKWICSIENLDDLIYNDIHNYYFSITSEERWNY